MKKTLFSIIIFFACYTFAQIPAYYSSIDFSQTGEALKTQIANLITTTHHTTLPYTSSSTDTWDAVYQTDENPTDIQKVLLIYGWNDTDATHTNDYSRLKTLSCHTSTCSGFWVREHVFARSWGTPALGFELAGADVHNLRSIDNDWNNTRSNRQFEDTTPQEYSYITPTGNWFPGNEWRGDVARMIMYMYLRYPTQCAALSAGVGSVSFSPLADMPNVFLIWNAIDPPTSYEHQRNTVLQNLQGNRNPFIDNPYLATLIWNGPQAIDNWQLSTVTNKFSQIQLYPTQTKDIVNIYNPNNETFSYDIYNAQGQLIKTSQEPTIDLSNYSKSLYYITFKLNDNTTSHKIFKY
jgi:endonuclease I